MTTELTAISTFGWYTQDSTHELNLMTSISTFGWYGVTLKDLIERYPTLNFGLIIDQLHSVGVEIQTIYEIENLSIQQVEELGNFNIAQMFGINLKR